MITLSELQRYVRASVWIPGLLESTETVLRLLNRQNSNLNTANWLIFADNLGPTEYGRSLFLGVPYSDYEKLKASNFKAFFGLDEVYFFFCNISQQNSVTTVRRNLWPF